MPHLTILNSHIPDEHSPGGAPLKTWPQQVDLGVLSTRTILPTAPQSRHLDTWADVAQSRRVVKLSHTLPAPWSLEVPSVHKQQHLEACYRKVQSLGPRQVKSPGGSNIPPSQLAPHHLNKITTSKANILMSSEQEHHKQNVKASVLTEPSTPRKDITKATVLLIVEDGSVQGLGHEVADRALFILCVTNTVCLSVCLSVCVCLSGCVCTCAYMNMDSNVPCHLCHT